MAMNLIMHIESGVFIIHIFTTLSIGIAGITILITVMDIHPFRFHGIWVGVTPVTVGDIQVMVGDILIIAGEVDIIQVMVAVITPVMVVAIIPVILHIQFTRAVAAEIIHTEREGQQVQVLQETMEEDQHRICQQEILPQEIKVLTKLLLLNREDQLPAQAFVLQQEIPAAEQKLLQLTIY